VASELSAINDERMEAILVVAPSSDGNALVGMGVAFGDHSRQVASSFSNSLLAPHYLGEMVKMLPPTSKTSSG
jgi:hypothetical protein